VPAVQVTGRPVTHQERVRVTGGAPAQLACLGVEDGDDTGGPGGGVVVDEVIDAGEDLVGLDPAAAVDCAL
jgi:hypothetical protein